MELETTLNWQKSLALGYKDESPNCNLYVNFMWVRENVWVRRENKKKKKIKHCKCTPPSTLRY